MAEIVLYFALWLAGGLVLQLLLLRLTRNRFRFLRVLPLVVVGWQGFNALRAYGAGGLFIGLNALAALVFLLQGGAFLAGWGLAWLLWRRRGRDG
mgnify:FL=1